MILSREMRVSSPYRYAKNSPHRRLVRWACSVSSPYRYAKNAVDICVLFDSVKFQVLIGTLKTIRYHHNIETSSTFQVLIGTLKTCPGVFILFIKLQVSSPYRYAKNITENSRFTPLPGVSSPYRYAKNQSADGLHAHILRVSSPYRYAKNICSLFLFHSLRLVSSPYRYAKNTAEQAAVARRSLVSSPYRYAKNPFWMSTLLKLYICQKLVI